MPEEGISLVQYFQTEKYLYHSLAFLNILFLYDFYLNFSSFTVCENEGGWEY
jgi:hypothetical protein